jgi:hypothetical protein
MYCTLASLALNSFVVLSTLGAFAVKADFTLQKLCLSGLFH